jgi:hypothetical protein
MSARALTPLAVVRAIEGIVAVCLGSSDCVLWIDQPDAAAFCDDEAIYLPRPTGKHEQEYQLLIALALREIAKLWFTKAAVFAATDAGTLPFAAVLEEVRLKARLSREFRGTPEIFNRAVAIASDLHAVRLGRSERHPAEVQVLTIWAAAHEALLETAETSERRETFEAMALEWTGPLKLQQAIDLAVQGPTLKSSQQAVALGARIRDLFQDHETGGMPAHQGEGVDQSKDPKGMSDRVVADDQPGERGERSHDDDESANADGDGSGDAPAQPLAHAGDAATQTPQSEEPGDNGSSVQGRECEAGDATEVGRGATPQASEREDAGSADAASSPGTEKAASGRGGGNSSTDSRGAAAIDPLSDALAMLKGHERSRDVSSMAAVFQAQAMEAATAPVSNSGMQALRELLDAPMPSIEVFAEAASAGIGESPWDGDDAPAGLAALLDAGGGPAEIRDGAGRTLLPGIPGKLVTVLLRALQALKRRPFLLSAAGPRIATSQLWRLKQLGDTRVFRKRAGAIGVDAAISVLLDRSGSMKEHGFEQAVEVTQAFLLALQRINGVRTSLDVFPGTESVSEEILAFGQNVGASRDRLAAIEPDGGTPTGSAIAHRLRRLLAIRARKRLMVVITDGKPDAPEVALAEAVIAQAGMLGVQVIGVGIGVALGHLFPASVSVNAVAELPDALAALFENELARRLVD